MSTIAEKGLKFDEGKPMIALVPMYELIRFGVDDSYLSRLPEVMCLEGEEVIREWEVLLAMYAENIRSTPDIEYEAGSLGKALALLNRYLVDRRDGMLTFYEVLYPIAKVYEFGANKYGLNNWRKFEPTALERYRFASAAYRHFNEFFKDRDKADNESGLPHIYHCVWNLVMLFCLNTRCAEALNAPNNDMK